VSANRFVARLALLLAAGLFVSEPAMPASILASVAVEDSGEGAGASYFTLFGLTLTENPPAFAVTGEPELPGALAATLTAAGPRTSAYVDVSLPAVTIKAVATAASSDLFDSAQAAGIIEDVLTFVNTSGAVALLGIEYDITGEVVGEHMDNGGRLAFGDAHVGFRRLALGELGAAEGPIDVFGWESYTVSSPRRGNSGMSFSAIYALPVGVSTLRFEQSLAANCWKTGSCDYGHTAAFDMSLPAGVTFTSESGVFLTAPVSEVPEPSTVLLSLAGLTGVLIASRRKDIRSGF
jgi:hypothetical protein